ncbi:histone chaperone asf-1 [Planoprotostelium fungivorum]|uniref:Histone chaperone asf-1 n=1 Tax=Planoprotostelium fungivorum TaxID=1890364 RepID=A0A2P6NKH4_9EUKA|nr:histone chaperone asf-1 [Planoprotostelium fungivorum]
MNAVIVHRVGVVCNNPSRWWDPLQFEICYECYKDLEEDLEWKITYISSGFSDCDQILDSVLVGPITTGVSSFILEANSPDPLQIPQDEILGVTVMLVSCSYKEREFIRVGYYVSNDYDNEELKMQPPEIPAIDRILRTIVADQPRITHFAIGWD